MKKVSVGALLMEKGYFESEKQAVPWVMAGKVLCNQTRIDSLAEKVSPDAALVVKGLGQKYVGKGGLKLEGALDAFGINPAQRVVIDAGASTGGFTDCLVKKGAALVYAVDVGYGQLAGSLRQNTRVVNLEKVNISDAILRSLSPAPTLATADLSYLSLKKAIPVFAEILRFEGDLICLVKPLFEVESSEVRKTGVIEDVALYREVLLDLLSYCRENGYYPVGITNSSVTGNKGTREFFLHISLTETPKAKAYTPQLQALEMEQAIQRVMAIETFKK